ncbi:DNA-processing protein DprA [Planctomycetota bacterium]
MIEVQERLADTPVADLVRVNMTPGVGVKILGRILERFGSLGRALAASPAALRSVRGVGPARMQALQRTGAEAAAGELRLAARLGVEVLGYGQPGYPESLLGIDGAPLVLYVRGQLNPGALRAALVGSRRASPYGRRIARRLAAELAHSGVTVVSGLARGVDAEAHRGVLEAGGRTVAVLGCGLDRCYPREHGELLLQCSRSGAVVSEFPLGTLPLPEHFPRRNRIIAGLSQATCVVAASKRSGSLTTAAWALEQGREVLAVPHRLDDPGAPGVLQLLRDGAHPITGVRDILAALGVDDAPDPTDRDRSGSQSSTRAASSRLSSVERTVYGTLTPDPTALDDIIEAARLPAATVFGALLDLEQKQLVAAGPGQAFAVR